MSPNSNVPMHYSLVVFCAGLMMMANDHEQRRDHVRNSVDGLLKSLSLAG
jgi:hypothetical protein